MLFIRQNATHKVVIGPAVAVGDGFTPVTTLVLTGAGAADEAEVILHDNATVVDISAYTWAAIATADGYYHLTLAAGISSTVGHMTVVINDDSLILPLRADFTVMEEAAYDAMYKAAAVGPTTTKTGYTLTNLSDANAAKLEDILDGTGGTGIKVNSIENTGTTTLTGNTTLAGTLTTGAVTLASAAVTGALSVGTTTTLTGNVTLSGTLGVAGATTLAPVTITGSGTALSIVSSGANGKGVSIAGNGSGEGMLLTGGATGAGLTATGAAGITATGGTAAGILVSATSAAGIQITGGTTNEGVLVKGGSTSGSGMKIYADGTNDIGLEIVGIGSGTGMKVTGGTTGAGFEVVGGATSGSGAKIWANGTNDAGLEIIGIGTGSGMSVTGGAGATSYGLIVSGTANGLYASGEYGAVFEGSAGPGLQALGTTYGLDAQASGGTGIAATGVGAGAGMSATGGATGHGASCLGGAAGHGLYCFGGATSGDGIYAAGQTAGDGMTLVAAGASQYDLNADIYGTVTGNITGGITGDITGDLSGSVGTVTNGVSLANDAITSAKYDESTAFPVKSADTGSTKIARVGADSDTLETLSDQLDAVAASPTVLQTTTIKALASQTSFTITAGSTDNKAYKDAYAIVTDASTSTQKCVGRVSAYTGATRTVTLGADPGIFTMANGDAISIVANHPYLDAAISSITGAGAVTHTHTVYLSDEETVVADCDVRVSTDEAGTNWVYGPVQTNASGVATLYLDAGTYYAWHQKAGVTFSTNPTEITVAA